MKWSLLIPLFFCLLQGSMAQMPASGTGSFVFNEYSPMKDKPLRVHYHIPQGRTENMPILFTFHGEDRNAATYRDAWLDAANKYGIIIIAPEFDERNFSGANSYNLLNIFQNGESPSVATLNPDSLWTGALLEPLFQYIKLSTRNKYNHYLAFGHSAGAQFLHRYQYFYPNANMKLAFCANAGWYTMPSTNISFPYGLGFTPFNAKQLQAVFSKKIILLLGTADTNPNAAGLRRNPEADAQGTNRFQRGNYFYLTTSNIALNVNTPFAWQKIEIEGVGHDQRIMALNAVPHLIQAIQEEFPASSVAPINLFVHNGKVNIQGLNRGELIQYSVYSAEGKLHYQYQGNPADEHSQDLPIGQGFYALKLNTSFHGAQTVRFIKN